MDSLSHAAQIIDATLRPDGMAALLTMLGFDGPTYPLDDTSLRRLELPTEVVSAGIRTGDGALRAFTVEIEQRTDVRDCIKSVAHRLSMQAPHLLWIVVVSTRNAPAIGIATWRCARPERPDIAAMIAERGRIVDSDAETFCALAAATTAGGEDVRYARWLDILGRDALTRRFFHALANAIDSMALSLHATVPVDDARELAILTSSRLLFLAFLETKGWLDADFGFLANRFAECMASRGSYQRHVLEPLFFGALNTKVSARAPRSRGFGRIPFLNGGLFSRTTLERIHRHARFSDEALGALFGDVLVRYRFTPREDDTTWSQAAIDPEMLGKVFESLMHPTDRKRGGVFYTPQRYVDRLTTLTLAPTLERCGVAAADIDSLLNLSDAPVAPNPPALKAIASLTVLDPACGSGAFLVHVMERLTRMRIVLGDADTASDVRRSVLCRSIFGVDSSAVAVWLCELRLWLATVIDSDERDPMRLRPLPNLDRQIRIGDSLAGEAFRPRNADGRRIHCTSALRDRYARSSGRRKLSLGRQLDLVERGHALNAIDTRVATATFARHEIVQAARSRDLFNTRRPPRARDRDRLLDLRASLRALRRQRIAITRGATPAFAYPTHFADVAQNGGFDIVVGNPPWIRTHNIDAHDRARYRHSFAVVRRAAWSSGARAAHAGSGFAGQTDLAALFVERSVDLLATDGVVGLLLPSKLWSSLAGGGAREFMLDNTRIVTLEDHSAGVDAFDAAVYPSMLVATCHSQRTPDHSQPISVGVQNRKRIVHWRVVARDISLDSSPGSPWLLLPPDARDAFDCFSRAGAPLFTSPIGRPRLGVKTGCNKAFVVRRIANDGAATTISSEGQHGVVETHMLRPLVRGESLTRWRLTPGDERIVWTHDDTGTPHRTLPPLTQRWLLRSRRALERRSDAHSERWWSLFRVESACATSSRVIWADFGRSPKAAVVSPGDATVPLNTCYSVKCRDSADALAFAAILNSRIAAAWLGVIAEPARGGYRRYMGWTVARLPVPNDWQRATNLLAPIAERACNGAEPSDDELDAAVLAAYNLHNSALSPLLDWMNVQRGD